MSCLFVCALLHNLLLSSFSLLVGEQLLLVVKVIYCCPGDLDTDLDLDPSCPQLLFPRLPS